MKAIERAVHHYKSLPRIEIAVPEWADEGEDPFMVYANALTLKDAETLTKATRDKEMPAMWAEVVYRHAEDADGNKLFPDKQDRITLMRSVDRLVLERIAAGIMSTVSSVEEQAKN